MVSRVTGLPVAWTAAERLEGLGRGRVDGASRDADIRAAVRLDTGPRACRSGDGVPIAAYLGSGDSFDEAVGRLAEAYADQNELDYRTLVDAVDHGRIRATNTVVGVLDPWREPTLI
jgi:hypothetical protein